MWPYSAWQQPMMIQQHSLRRRQMYDNDVHTFIAQDATVCCALLTIDIMTLCMHGMVAMDDGWRHDHE
jgi:hypothetical protein